MTQLIKQTRPAYRLLLCIALLFMGSMRGAALNWNTWIGDEIKKIETNISYLTEENKTQHEAFRKLMAAAKDVEDEFVKTNPNYEKITNAFTAMQGSAAGWIFGADAVNVIWEKIKGCAKIPRAIKDAISFADLAKKFKEYEKNTSSTFKTTAEAKKITAAMTECLKGQGYSAKPYLDLVIDYPTNKNNNFKDLATAKNFLAEQKDRLTTLQKTQKAIDTLFKDMGKDSVTMYKAMLAVTTSLKTSLPAIKLYFDALSSNDKQAFNSNILNTQQKLSDFSAIKAMKAYFEQAIKLSFYQAIYDVLSTQKNQDAIIATFYATGTKNIKPANFIDSLNINNEIIQILISLNDFKLVDGATKIKKLDEYVAAAADIISLVAGTDTKRINAYKDGLKLHFGSNPPLDTNSFVIQFYSDRLDGKKDKRTFSTSITAFLEDLAIKANNAAFNALTSFGSAYIKNGAKTDRSLLDAIPPLAKTAIKQNLLWIQLISEAEVTKAVERITKLENKDTYPITKAFLNAIAAAYGTNPSATGNGLDAAVETIYDTHMASAIKKYEETSVITPPEQQKPAEPIKPPEQPAEQPKLTEQPAQQPQAETEIKVLPAIEKFASALKIITTKA